MLYYHESVKKVLSELKTDPKGLQEEEVLNRQAQYGKNQIKAKKQVSPWKIFLNQFKSALIIILIVATIVSALIGEMVDSIVIMIIVILNAVFGFVQEYKAEKAIESLKKMMNPHSKVIRNGKKILIDSSQLTVGDILVLEEGDKIAADARLIEVVNLEIAEATLTGESLPVKKHIEAIEEEIVLADQNNMVFSWTIVTKWHGKAIVTNIGMKTEIGKIADLIQSSPDKKTNLQEKLEKLSKWLGLSVLVICGIIFLTYYFVNDMWLAASFLTAIALAVAAIPEGLPAVVTISLGMGVKRMANKNALMRKLSSVETLGAVDVICTDKTWTLTKNEMTVRKLYVNHQIIDVQWSGYDKEWGFSQDPNFFLKLLEIGMLCNHAEFQDDQVIGDPTEWCLLISAAKAGLDRDYLEQVYKWIDEVTFDSTRKMMSTIHESKGKKYLFAKGAPEMVIEKCDRILIDGEIRKLTLQECEDILKHNVKFGKKALRVLWFAYREVTNIHKHDGENIHELEQKLIWVGLQAMIDPPREEVKIAIQECKEAGIRVIMITGDNMVTAKAIWQELGIEWNAIQGLALEKYSDKELIKVLDDVSIFARVNPEHKQRIVTLLKEKWHIVAMTWDGVNDAPALKKANIGVAMGITGTDVAKEASDMILTDDNFATIVKAIEEGRWIFDNIKKFVNFLLSTNFWEIMIIFTISVMGLPLPLIAIQILWINLVTDGLPALALGVDPMSKGIMKRKPRNAKQWIVTKWMLRNIATISILMTLAAVFVFLRHHETDVTQARSAVFILMVLMEMVRIQFIRAKYKLGIFENKWLLGAIVLSIGLVMLVIYTPLNIIFKTAPLSQAMWIDVLIAFGAVVVAGFGVSKAIYWWYHGRKK